MEAECQRSGCTDKKQFSEVFHGIFLSLVAERVQSLHLPSTSFKDK
jgi:hypothetical protein